MTETRITDAAQLNKYAELATSQAAPVAPRPTIEVPSDTEVTLPGGALVFGGEPITHVEVRELTGFDEEKISRVPGTNTGKLLSTILELGTVKLGDEKATPADLEDLLVGDREAILLGIRIATYGKTLDMTLQCPRCQTELKGVLDLTSDIPVRKLDGGRMFDVELSKGRTAVVAMPTGREQKALLNATDKTTAEMNTVLLAGCVKTLDGMPVLGPGDILRLGMRDRETLVKEIAERRIGPQFGEVTLPCQGCDNDINIALSLADLFRL